MGGIPRQGLPREEHVVRVDNSRGSPSRTFSLDRATRSTATTIEGFAHTEVIG